MSITGRELVSESLKLIGVIASGETASAAETTDGLSVANRMLGSWSTESLMIPAKDREAFSLVSGQAAYTMGVGGNFNTSRPMKIESALIRLLTTSPVTEVPLEEYNIDQFASIRDKTTESEFPQYFYVEYNNPLVTINLWTVPSAANGIAIYSWKPLSTFANANASLDFYPGTEEALIYNLAIRLAPQYGKTVAAEVVDVATKSKANLKRMNSRPVYLQCDRGVLGGRTFNIYTGDCR